MFAFHHFARGDVSGDSFIEAKAREKAERTREFLFAVAPFLRHICEARRARYIQDICLGRRSGHEALPLPSVSRIIAPRRGSQNDRLLQGGELRPTAKADALLFFALGG